MVLVQRLIQDNTKNLNEPFFYLGNKNQEMDRFDLYFEYLK